MPGTAETTFWERLLRRRRFRALLALLCLAAVSVVSAFLLTPSRLTPPIPGDESLGQVATRTIKANRDLDVLDAEATSQKREEAARSVGPVYDYDASAGDVLRQRISQAFTEARSAIEEWKRLEPAKAGRVQLDLSHAARTKNADEQILLRFLQTRRDEFWKSLQAVIDDADFQELARVGFDPAVERAAERLANLATADFAVAERELLSADRERGIVVRPLLGQAVAGPERKVRDIDRIRDLASLRAEVDRLAQEQLGDLPAGVRRAVAQIVRRALRPNLAYDDHETRRRQDEKRAAVKEAILQVRRGEKIIGDGETITKTHLLIFQAMRAAGRSSQDTQVRWGGGLFAALVCSALYVFARRNVRKFRLRTRDVVLLTTVLALQLLVVRGSVLGAEALRDLAHDQIPAPLAALAGEALFGAVPIAAGSMLVGFLLTSEAALVWTAAFAPLAGVLVAAGLQPAVLALVAGVVAADRVAHATSRGAVFGAGLWTAGASICVLVAFALFQGRFLQPETAAAAVGALVAGAVLTPIVVLFAARLLQPVFGYVTGVQLHELASFNHPLLKDLIVQAPGTYHHGIVCGALVEAAAREIGANPLLARVGAYYHDIGKGKNPVFFGENRRGENRHDALQPSVSAQIIRRHVDDGVEVAHKGGLPRPIVDFILQHHGTRLIGYFFHKAREEAQKRGEPPPDEAEYRYPGAKPRSREIALVMIGDMVVATARSVDEPSLPRLQKLVAHAIQAIAADGQLDECDLTLHDLAAIERSFALTLLGLSGARPETPPEERPALRVLAPEPKARLAGK
ncbi:MAG: HD family phosphohydrolase [Myxococcales bacterium]